jgi:hypothetical protein
VVEYHGLARRDLMPLRLLMRPQLNGATLARLVVDPNETVNSDHVASLVRGELQNIRDDTVRQALASRVGEPARHLRDWDYGPPSQRFPCWTIVADPSSDTALVYSLFGFGPPSPWGLVSLSQPGFGMDCSWYSRLEDAFIESHMASPLPIWDLVSPDGHIVLRSVSSDEAFATRDKLDAGLTKPRHHVLYRSRHPDGIP